MIKIRKPWPAWDANRHSGILPFEITAINCAVLTWFYTEYIVLWPSIHTVSASGLTYTVSGGLRHFILVAYLESGIITALCIRLCMGFSLIISGLFSSLTKDLRSLCSIYFNWVLMTENYKVINCILSFIKTNFLL